MLVASIVDPFPLLECQVSRHTLFGSLKAHWCSHAPSGLQRESHGGCYAVWPVYKEHHSKRSWDTVTVYYWLLSCGSIELLTALAPVSFWLTLEPPYLCAWPVCLGRPGLWWPSTVSHVLMSASWESFKLVSVSSSHNRALIGSYFANTTQETFSNTWR